MSRSWQILFVLAPIIAAFPASAQPVVPSSAHAPADVTNIMPPTPQSPVAFFRQLLAMHPAELEKSLANRPAVSRARIMAKVHEYQKLSHDECELRLRATDLRWYLTPLLGMSPTNRAASVAQVPPELQDLVASRLVEWDSLSPDLQHEFLANDQTLGYVTHVEAPSAPSPDPQQSQITERVREFFDLKPEEKQKLLGALSDSERAQMEQTLKTFDALPIKQRALCIRNYAKFAGMTPSERAEFLKNAQSWSQMPAQDRQTWRDLVANVPALPPMPVPAPPIPPNIVPHVIHPTNTGVATK